MRKGILGSLTALLAGSSLALAQPPASTDSSAPAAPNAASPPAASPAPPAGGPLLVPSPSPYWPDPLGKGQCVGPYCGVPALHEPPEEKSQNQFVIWGSAEYLLWWVKNQPLSTPLVTTGTQAAPLGVPPGASVLFGGSDIDYNAFSGGRFTLGMGLGQNGNADWGVEASGFFLEKRVTNFAASSGENGIPVLARPFVNANSGTPDALLVSAPAVTSILPVAAGTVAVSSFSDMYGWDIDLVGACYRDGNLRVQLLGGFRYQNLTEGIDIAQNTTLLPGGVAGAGLVLPGNVLLPPGSESILDHFGTRNEFYGGQLGGRLDYSFGNLILSGLFKIGLGNTHEVVNLSGFTTPTGGATVPAGLLVVSSNAGARAHDEFAAIPEIGINLGYQVCHNLRLYVGYTFLYWSDVVRPGNQINPVINPNLVPSSVSFATPVNPSAVPTFTFQRTDFWAQGVNFGFELRF
jgi:hypothetical protein